MSGESKFSLESILADVAAKAEPVTDAPAEVPEAAAAAETETVILPEVSEEKQPEEAAAAEAKTIVLPEIPAEKLPEAPEEEPESALSDKFPAELPEPKAKQEEQPKAPAADFGWDAEAVASDHSHSVAPFVPRKPLPDRAFPGAVLPPRGRWMCCAGFPGRLGSLAQPQRRGTSP